MRARFPVNIRPTCVHLVKTPCPGRRRLALGKLENLRPKPHLPGQGVLTAAFRLTLPDVQLLQVGPCSFVPRSCADRG